MGRVVCSADAGRVYAERHARSASEDAWLGLFMATVAGLLARGAHRLDQSSRRARGARLRQSLEPVPLWLVRGVHAMDHWARESPVSLPPPLGDIIGVLPAETLLALVDEEHEMVLPAQLDPMRMTALAKPLTKGPAGKRAEWAFYRGVHAWFSARYAVEPKPSQVTLLAAHVGLEEFDRASDVTVRWTDRIRLWRKQAPSTVEEWVAPWRELDDGALAHLGRQAALFVDEALTRHA